MCLDKHEPKNSDAFLYPILLHFTFCLKPEEIDENELQHNLEMPAYIWRSIIMNYNGLGCIAVVAADVIQLFFFVVYLLQEVFLFLTRQSGACSMFGKKCD